jgi:hypothetical protein
VLMWTSLCVSVHMWDGREKEKGQSPGIS